MEWANPTIGAVCVSTEQHDPRREPESEFRYVDIAGIDRGHKRITESQRLLGAAAPSRARKVIRRDDVIVSTVRPNLNAVAIVPEDLDGEIASTGFCVLRANRALVEPRYLFYWTISPDFVGALSAKVRGANYPAVSDGDVKDIGIPLPPLPEQRRIVEILEQADHLRRLRTDADTKAERITPALFLKMFGDPTTNPMLWPIYPLGELSTHITSGSRGWAKYTGKGSGFFVRTQDVRDGEISTELLAVDPPAGAESERTRLFEGDVVVTITGIVGKAGLVRDTSRDLYVSQHVALIRPRRDQLLPEYFAAYANLPLGEIPVLARFQYGQTKPGLGFRELRTARIPRPPVELQGTFSEHALSVRVLRNARRQSRRVVESLWSHVLQAAFSGSLTGSWRETHLMELLEEMEHQAKALAEA